MKLTKTKLKQIIKEELEEQNLLDEQEIPNVDERSWVNRDGTPNFKAMKAGLAAGGYEKGKEGGLKTWLRNRKGQGYLKAFRAYWNARNKSKQPARGAGLVKTDTGQGQTGHTALKKPEDLGSIKPKTSRAPSEIIQKIDELQVTIQSLSDEVRALDLDIVIPHEHGKGQTRLASAIQNGWSALNHVKRELYKIVMKERG